MIEWSGKIGGAGGGGGGDLGDLGGLALDTDSVKLYDSTVKETAEIIRSINRQNQSTGMKEDAANSAAGDEYAVDAFEQVTKGLPPADDDNTAESFRASAEGDRRPVSARSRGAATPIAEEIVVAAPPDRARPPSRCAVPRAD